MDSIQAKKIKTLYLHYYYNFETKTNFCFEYLLGKSETKINLLFIMDMSSEDGRPPFTIINAGAKGSRLILQHLNTPHNQRNKAYKNPLSFVHLRKR